MSVSKKFENIRHRSSLRGLKRCATCGEYNGQRSAVCRNESCESRKLASNRPYDPIKIVSHASTNSTLYSLRSRERDARVRSFVHIQREGSDGGRCTSICYVENCKSAMGRNCKHIEACITSAACPPADVYTVSREVMWNLNIGEQQKQRLWHVCQTKAACVPAVQRLNECNFVVPCTQSEMFPASLLHVTALSDGLPTKKGTYGCACNNLKIILQPDNSVVMQEEVCDHILLVLAAILSRQNGKFAYSNFTNALKSFWMPLEVPEMKVSEHSDMVPDNFFGLSISNIGDEYACDNIPDFPSSPTGFTQSITQLFGFDGKADTDAESTSAITTIAAVDADELNVDTHLELSDCNIELMDQFELTDHIDLSSDDILKLSSSPTEFANAISILSPSITFDQLHSDEPSAVSTSAPTINAAPLLQCDDANATTTLPTIELPTIAVVKKCPVKTTALVNEVKTRKFPHIPAKRALIVNSSEAVSRPTAPSANEDDEPKLAYSAWFEYVIETINQSIQITEQTAIAHNFHVHEEMFAHFSKTFTNGNKWRMPNSTTVLSNGPHRGLTKYEWYFTSNAIVQRIFSTKNISIQLRRFFECHNGKYVDYTQPNFAMEPKRRIYPKIQLHSAHVLFNNENHKTGVLVEWLPNVYPKSHFGLLTIKFTLDIKHPMLNVCR